MGSTVPDDSFRRALHLAVADGLIIAPDIQDRGPKEPIHDDDELSARTADLILQSHPLVRASGQVDEFRSRVVEKVYEMGAATLDELREGLDVDDSAGVETVLALEAGIAEALAQGVLDWVPQSVRLKLGVPFYGPPLGKLAEPSLYAMPRDKAEREWKPPGGPSEAARRMQDAMSVFRADLATFRRASAARKASVGGGGSDATEDASENAPRRVARRRAAQGRCR